MPITKKLVVLPGGTITITSEVGRCIKFTVTFPCRVADKESMEKSHEASAEIAANEFAGKKIS